jgi:DNA-binding NarL/FixJ family response regulator
MNTLFSTHKSSLQNRQSTLHIGAQNDHFSSVQASEIGRTALEAHLVNVLVLSEDNTILYVTESFEDKLQSLMKSEEDEAAIPQEIKMICQVLQQCRGRFPNQNWAIEFDIFTKSASTLRIRSRWLNLSGYDKPCIMLVMEDQQQLVQDMVLSEVQAWGLTPREQEVWLLHQDGYTYNQIAEELYITINTVKKHMRSIHSKRRSQIDEQAN